LSKLAIGSDIYLKFFVGKDFLANLADGWFIFNYQDFPYFMTPSLSLLIGSSTKRWYLCPTRSQRVSGQFPYLFATIYTIKRDYRIAVSQMLNFL